MSQLKTIKKIVTGQRAVDGAGVKLVRVFGNYDTKDFDPFLMLDAFDSTNPNDYTKGFPWHPHRGIETITYLIKGDIEHGDNLGNRGSILDGDCQWMTAGSGIVHQELPKSSERLLGAQLWLNLPAKDKMTDPIYGDIKKKDIPVIEENGTKIRVIAGDYFGTKGAFEGKFVKATYLDVEIPKGKEWSFSNEKDNTLFIYIFSGKAIFDPSKSIENVKDLIDEKQAVLFNNGEKFWIKAADHGIRFILLTAKPVNEPIAWGGPIVMNTREELNKAFKELDSNTFIKKH